MEWVATGRVFGPDEALAAGLVRSVHPPEELLPAAYELAREIAENTSAISVALSRQMMWRMLGESHPMAAHRLDSADHEPDRRRPRPRGGRRVVPRQAAARVPGPGQQGHAAPLPLVAGGGVPPPGGAGTGSRRARDDDVRLHRGGRGVRGLCAREPPLRGPEDVRPADRGGRPGRHTADQDAQGIRQAPWRPPVRLALPGRAGRPQPPCRALGPRPDARRIQLGQRHGLQPR